MHLIEIIDKPKVDAMLAASVARVGAVVFTYNQERGRWVSDICDEHWVDGDTLVMMGAKFYRRMTRERAVLNGPRYTDAVGAEGAWNPMLEWFKEYAGFSIDSSRHRIFVYDKNDAEAVAAIGKLMEGN